ncbi:MAG: hypothetical protein WBA25_18335 [Jannaschia sp.]
MVARTQGPSLPIRPSDIPDSPVPPAAIERIEASDDRIGLLAPDGRIVTLSNRLASDLGFDGPADLQGLVVSSLWDHADRAAVHNALGRAREGERGDAPVGLAYVCGDPVEGRVSFAPGTPDRTILMTLDWNCDDA